MKRQAWGADVLIAPFNFLMGLPNFLLRLLALLLGACGARSAARWLVRRHLGFPTSVEEALKGRLMAELLDLPMTADDAGDPI